VRLRQEVQALPRGAGLAFPRSPKPSNGTLYVGVTNDLVRRIYEHREGLAEGFTRQYGVKTLVWFETSPSIEAAIAHEKQIKNWKREWKLELIEETNPEWIDLYPGLLGG
jgi:putative endonuclease